MSPILDSLAGLSANAFGMFLPSSLGSFESIQTVTVGAGGASSISFTSIPQTYTHLHLSGIARSNRADYAEFMKVQFNSDTAANYSDHHLYGDGTSAAADADTAATYISVIRIAGGNAVANGFGGGFMDILDYASASKYKSTRSLFGYDDNGQGQVALTGGLWLSTAAIAAITLSPGTGTLFSQYTSFALYGLKG